MLHNQDNREHDLLDSDDYYQFEGGLAAAVKQLSGRQPDDLPQRPLAPRERRASARSTRRSPASCAPASSIRNGSQGVMRHGYKGAFEMAATVDYLFAFAATTGMRRRPSFRRRVRRLPRRRCGARLHARPQPGGCREMAERLLEAQDRGLWRPKSNSSHALLQDLATGPHPSPLPLRRGDSV